MKNLADSGIIIQAIDLSHPQPSRHKFYPKFLTGICNDQLYEFIGNNHLLYEQELQYLS